MDYAEIKVRNSCQSVKPYSEKGKVKYANILMESCEQGKFLQYQSFSYQLIRIAFIQIKI